LETLQYNLNYVRTDITLRILKKISEREPLNNICVDVGSSNGVDYEPLHCLFINNWNGLAFEADPAKHAALCVHAPNKGLEKINIFVTPTNLIEYMGKYNIPKIFDAFDIDIDGYDFFVVKEMLKNGYLPRVLSLECNTIFPPGLIYTTLYNEGAFWAGNTHFLGASFELFNMLLQKYEYEPIYYDWENAYFVQKRFLDMFDINDRSVQSLWSKGYWNRPGRGHGDFFSWNNDFNAIVPLSPKNQIEFVNKHAHFSPHIGKFFISHKSMITKEQIDSLIE
jgi:hypothetical protein